MSSDKFASAFSTSLANCTNDTFALSDAISNRAKTVATLCDYTEAVDSFDKAIAINPNYAEAWYQRGVGLHILGHDSDAVSSYDKAIAINPKDANV